jgi:hypothetical protein
MKALKCTSVVMHFLISGCSRPDKAKVQVSIQEVLDHVVSNYPGFKAGWERVPSLDDTRHRAIVLNSNIALAE